ncbi:MAG: MBL fold metallo-hydrolase [Acidobacteria bacterium]|nr:MBL fold metallo-hydrolase [Acidobacteriota bacterium]
MPTNRLLLRFCSLLVFLVILPRFSPAQSPSGAQTDVVETSQGNLQITPINHASLMLQFGGKVIHVDPVSQGNYQGLPQADLILITDIHPDHMDRAMIDRLKKPATVVVAPPAVAQTITEAQVLANGPKKTVVGIEIEAVPMYNLTRGPEPGKHYHDKGRGNGYILTLGDKRLYLSGDTECIPEMKALQNIDIAFVCMNLPYTMPPAEAAACVQAFRPKIVYPYHYNQSNLKEFTDALQGTPSVEVRLRKWY